MRPRKYLFAFCLALMASGCSAVYTAKPMGERPIGIHAEDWDGTWLNSQGESFSLRVMDEEKGIFRIAWIEWDKDKKEAKSESFEVQLRQWGEGMFVSIRFPPVEKSETEGKSEQVYLWGRIKRDHNVIIAWGPDEHKFKELVRSGKLPGKEEGNDVVLGNLAPQHLEIFFTSDVYDWDDPEVYIRVAW